MKYDDAFPTDVKKGSEEIVVACKQPSVSLADDIGWVADRVDHLLES